MHEILVIDTDFVLPLQDQDLVPCLDCSRSWVHVASAQI